MRWLIAFLVGVLMTGGPGVGRAQPPQTPVGSGDKKAEKPIDKSDEIPRVTAVGRVKSVSPNSLIVTGKSKGQAAEWTFVLDGKTKVRKAGKDVGVADLQEGDGVQVRYTEEGGKNIAHTVRARSTPPKPVEDSTGKKR